MNSHIQQYYGPGPSERHPARRDQMPRGFHEGRKPGRRSMVPQPYDDESHYSTNPGQHGGTRHTHNLPNVSLQDAMMDLYDLLKHAERYYYHFREDFENDTIRIKSYTRSDILGYLWASKVSESDNPRTRERPYSVEPRDGYETEEQASKEGFRATGKQIGRLFKVAITAADKLKSQRPSREGRIDSDGMQVRKNGMIGRRQDCTRVLYPGALTDSTNAARISEKLKTVYKDVTALLGSASRRVEDVQFLLTDLEMATTFLKGNGEGRARMGEDGRGEMQDPGVFDQNDEVPQGGHVEEEADGHS
ncbi:hypothetical protein MMC29_005707 [Sticta canariensis]|nr:hypothetical protein [Sticta canariensis]